jgi:acyl phosphate:glycerol-3-phosphate acyltransferase
MLAAGVMTVIGQNWPVFLRFRGGRGESTAIGVLLSVITQPMLITAVPAIIALWRLHDVTKASAVLFIPLPFLCWWLGYSGLLIGYRIALPCVVGLTHFLRTRSAQLQEST